VGERSGIILPAINLETIHPLASAIGDLKRAESLERLALLIGDVPGVSLARRNKAEAEQRLTSLTGMSREQFDDRVTGIRVR
jgi:hypothetical protein